MKHTKKLIVLAVLAAASLLAVTACDTPPTESSQVQSVPQEPPTLTLSVNLQQGDTTVQIPEFLSPGDNPYTKALNEKIRENHTTLYEDWKKNPEGVRNLEIKTYAFENERFVQAIVTQLEFPTYGTQGDVFSYNYDIKNHKVLTVDDVFPGFDGKFQRTPDDILSSMTFNLPANMQVKDSEIQGFRVLDNGGLECYAKVSFTDTSGRQEDYEQLYILHVDPSSEEIPCEAYDGTSLIPQPEEPPVSSVPDADMP